jgi:hypothetical protein
MRRSVAIVLTTLFGWLLLLPAFAASAETVVPPCCRKSGKHHCMSRMSHTNAAEPAVANINDKCPCLPQAAVTTHVEFATPVTSQAIFAGLLAHPTVSPQTEAGYRVSHFRARQKRGPPALFLS